MMNDPLDHLLDVRLREAATYIDDAGFTARVLKELPRRSVSPQAQRSLIIFLAAIVSVVVAFFASGEGMFVRDAFAQFARLTPLGVYTLVLMIGLLTTVGGFWAALTRARLSP